MKIYLASSWKNHKMVRDIAEYLRTEGHEVDDFTDDSQGRFVFSYKEITEDDQKLNAKNFMQDKRAQQAFKEDKSRIDWADTLICVLPCGLSAHMELGYAAGKGKKVIIYAPDGFAPGEWEVMYGFAEGMTESLKEIYKILGD
ncbi:nucleoside 2-deoxyribosyltransferase [Methanobacterium spitsbergense]|uniref:Nucleoside 2-deoxyribosyltransferase n=1 Tax=Methanobacterium spitsbergense TaxID=2874285 RepID=A0A8T5V525_9EURY|nr:nucleoside 2-deoxyribosyltransferase [Methanobacterium spitsbergense]MBZ2166991.1 nucleoside 2-deoxyribosyltransferase [Methanobacterium spitsbergense]